MDKLTDWTVHNFYKVSPTRKYVESFIEKLKDGYQPTSAELEKVIGMNQGLSILISQDTSPSSPTNSHRRNHYDHIQ